MKTNRFKIGDIIGFKHDSTLESEIIKIYGTNVVHQSTLTGNIYHASFNEIIKRRGVKAIKPQ